MFAPTRRERTRKSKQITEEDKKQILRYVADEISAIPNLRHVFNFFLSGTCLWLIYPGLQTNHFPSTLPTQILVNKHIYTLNVYNYLLG